VGALQAARRAFCLGGSGVKSLLRLDFLSRKNCFKTLFGRTAERRKIVGSDFTLQRIARWIKPEQAQMFQLSFLDSYTELGAFPIRLVPGSPPRRIGIIDGSYMGGHFLAAPALWGKVRYPVLLCGYANRGRELEAGKQHILTGWDFKNGQEGLDYYRLLPYRSGN
jgi:hypothetical protein